MTDGNHNKKYNLDSAAFIYLDFMYVLHIILHQAKI